MWMPLCPPKLLQSAGGRARWGVYSRSKANPVRRKECEIAIHATPVTVISEFAVLRPR